MPRLIRDLFTKEWRWVEYEPKTVYEAPRPNPKGPTFVPDISPFVSPIDKREITSRSQLREHEKRHRVRQCGELKSPADFSRENRPKPFNDRAFERAYRVAVEKTGL